MELGELKLGRGFRLEFVCCQEESITNETLRTFHFYENKRSTLT